MPETDYPHLHKWLMAHVNRAPNVTMRLLRHSNQTKSEDGFRNLIRYMCKGYLYAEVKAYEQGEACNADMASCFEQEVEKLDQEIDDECFTLEKHGEHQESIMDQFIGRIPLPRYSAAHAPGGDLETRDIAEQDHYHEALRELLAGRDTIAEQYEILHGPGYAFTHAKKKKDAKEKALLAGAERMRAVEEPTDNGPAKYLGYKAVTIRVWLKETDEGIVARSRKRSRNALRSGEAFQPERGEATDEARLSEFANRAMAAMRDHSCIKPVSRELAVRAPASYIAKETSQENIDRQVRRIQELLVGQETAQTVLTLVDELPRAEIEFSVLLKHFQDAFEGTTKGAHFEANSFCTALRWAAVSLGLTEHPEGDERRFNLRRFVEELDTPAIRAAQAAVDVDPNAQTRIDNRRAKRRATNAAAIAAAAEDDAMPVQISRRVRARVAADGAEDDMDME